mmetsp:Transcript_16376/g.20976  ORF Transcript_16376/g.20976 Transcript_16376/m.20976 type:complete len:113 (+) Transcript_16376:117-455(+)
MSKFFAVVLALCAALSSAFLQSMPKAATEIASAVRPEGIAKFATGAFPAAIAAPAFAQTEVLSELPTQLLSLEVTFAAYLAVLLGTFIPVAFLLIVYIQSEARKAGEESGSA